MDKNKKKVIIIIGVILAIISLLAIVLGLILKDEENNKPGSNLPSINNEPIIKKEIEKLNDDNVFFSLQSLLNNYYLLYSSKNKDVYDLLENDYKRSLNLTKNNLFEVLENIDGSPSFTPYEIYYNPNSDVTYYFIKGYYLNIPIIGDGEYKDDISFLVIVNNQNKYVIKPLRNVNDLESYAKNYYIKNIEISNNSNFIKNDISIKNKLILYLTNFQNLLVYDNKKAYGMVSENIKKRYSNNDFKNNLVDVYSAFSTNIFSYSEKTINNQKVYNIIDNNQNKIAIYENSIMNFTIDFEI